MAFKNRFRELRMETGWAEWVKVAVAVWLFISPWVLATATASGGGNAQGPDLAALSWNAWIAAVLIACTAVAAATERQPALEWLMLGLGAWIFISPWVLGFATPQLRAMDWNFWAIGALIFFVSLGELGFVQTRTATTVQPAGSPDLSYAGDRPQFERERRG